MRVRLRRSLRLFNREYKTINVVYYQALYSIKRSSFPTKTLAQQQRVMS
jgi:hypothetical protein